MTPDFDARKNSGHVSPGNSRDSRDMDILQRDRFELLSAYIDGEVTAAERKQVQQWLDTDPQTQHLYARMMKLRQEIQSLPVPQSEQSAEQMAKQVFARINRLRHKRTVVWGGTAIAALFFGALSSILPGQSPAPQLAKSPKPEQQPLMVALNRPVVEIPKAAVAKPLVEDGSINQNWNQAVEQNASK